MKILFIGDIFGSPGRFMVSQHLQKIVQENDIDLVIANGENAAHGKGITEKIYYQLMEVGVDVITMGNHTWAKPDTEFILKQPNIIRPMNIKEQFERSNQGRGTMEMEVKGVKVRITNLLGNSVLFRDMQSNAFRAMKNLLDTIDKPDLHIVDFHAETTSEKYAFMWAFNGKVDVIVGTHTHVPTNDACITNEGTAFVCDVGMTGPAHGVIGAKRDSIIEKFMNPDYKFIMDVQRGAKQLCAVIMEFDEEHKIMKKIDPFIIREGFKYIAGVEG